MTIRQKDNIDDLNCRIKCLTKDYFDKKISISEFGIACQELREKRSLIFTEIRENYVNEGYRSYNRKIKYRKI